MEGFSQVLWAHATLVELLPTLGYLALMTAVVMGGRRLAVPHGEDLRLRRPPGSAPRIPLPRRPSPGRKWARLPCPRTSPRSITAMAERARSASLALAVAPAAARNTALADLAGRIELSHDFLIDANGRDLAAAQGEQPDRGRGRPPDANAGQARASLRSPCARWRRCPTRSGRCWRRRSARTASGCARCACRSGSSASSSRPGRT